MPLTPDKCPPNSIETDTLASQTVHKIIFRPFFSRARAHAEKYGWSASIVQISLYSTSTVWVSAFRIIEVSVFQGCSSIHFHRKSFGTVTNCPDKCISGGPNWGVPLYFASERCTVHVSKQSEYYLLRFQNSSFNTSSQALTTSVLPAGSLISFCTEQHGLWTSQSPVEVARRQPFHLTEALQVCFLNWWIVSRGDTVRYWLCGFACASFLATDVEWSGQQPLNKGHLFTTDDLDCP